MVVQVSAKNTKDQILEAYEQLVEEQRQIQTRYNKLLAEKEALEKRALRPEAAAPGKAAVQKIADERAATVEAILGSLSALQGSFGSALGELSIKLTAEVTRLQELRQQAQAKAEQLEKLYGLVVAGDTLDRLIQEYEEKARAFQERAQQAREGLESETFTKHEVWQKEQEEHARSIKEQRELLKKERQRNEAEYNYQLDMARKLAVEQYEQQKKRLYRELDELIKAQEAAWQGREAALTAQEQEYKELKAKVDAFPRELDAAIKRAEKEGIESARRQAKVRYDLLAKEEEGQRRVAELEIQSLEETIHQQVEQIKHLSAQLEAVVRQDQELAVKAIEGASHETSFQSVREIALEQAKNIQKVK